MNFLKRLLIIVVFILMVIWIFLAITLGFTIGIVDWIITGENHIYNSWDKPIEFLLRLSSFEE